MNVYDHRSFFFFIFCLSSWKIQAFPAAAQAAKKKTMIIYIFTHIKENRVFKQFSKALRHSSFGYGNHGYIDDKNFTNLHNLYIKVKNSSFARVLFLYISQPLSSNLRVLQLCGLR